MNGRAKRVAPPTADFGSATWTRDGRYLVGSGSSGLAWIGASGGAAHALIDIKAPTAPWSFAPDGRLAYSTNSPTTALDMWTTPITTSDSGLRAGAPVALLHSPFYEAYPAFSPDGRWFAYTSNEGGPWEIYVRSVSDSTVKIQVSRGGGRVPRWSQAHSELFYATDDQRLMVATYAVRNGEFSVGGIATMDGESARGNRRVPKLRRRSRWTTNRRVAAIHERRRRSAGKPCHDDLQFRRRAQTSRSLKN